jgi:hypothetical protein
MATLEKKDGRFCSIGQICPGDQIMPLSIFAVDKCITNKYWDLNTSFPAGFWNERLMVLQRFLLAAVVAVSAIFASFPAHSEIQSSVSISNNSGGNIAAFALSVANYRSSGTLVKFDGRCDSACTLFLGLPSQQTCINRGASFRFHAPHSGSARSVQIAQAYLMRRYPVWVRSWIGRHNGLTSTLITMDYSYASKFIRTCDSIASR